jgi:hypothetical protein
MLVLVIVCGAVLATLAVVTYAVYRRSPQSAVSNARLTSVRDVASTVQSIFAVGAIIAASWWFFTNRQDQPRVRIEHILSQRPDTGEPGSIFLGVEVKVTNIGNVRVDLEKGAIELAEVNPLGKPLKTAQPEGVSLEPGESDQVYFAKLLLESSVRTVELQTSLEAGQGWRWNHRSLFDIGANTPSYGSSSSTGPQAESTPVPALPQSVRPLNKGSQSSKSK